MRTRVLISIIITLLVTPLFSPNVMALGEDPAPPAAPVKLVFIHHSTGGYWLADDHGQLGIELRNNNYFVSDTDYGWGLGAIGDRTDIGNWYEWFGNGRNSTVLSDLYNESDQHSGFGYYSRLPNDPGGENQIIIFKSCYPNSALRGNINDPIPAIGSNPLRNKNADSSYHTISNAKGIYLNLLTYFQTKPNKLFVVIAAPPLSAGTYASNARAFNNWLMDKTNGWLKNYPLNNVAVFDFYNVLTSNGGDSDTNDLNQISGNHHRYWQGAVQHKTDGGSNILAYPTGDEHPSAAGDQKASKEFVPMLNIFYNQWKNSPSATATPVPPTATATQPAPTINPTPVIVFDFSARRQTSLAVALTWKTTMAVNTIGFNIFRKDKAGNEVRINPTLIPVSRPGASDLVTYYYLDAGAAPGVNFSYRLEAQERNTPAQTVGEAVTLGAYLFIPLVRGTNP